MSYVQATYRTPTADDVSFIYNSWLKSFRGNSTWAQSIPGQIYFANHKKVIAKILQDSGVIVAANPENTEQIFGYVVYQPTTSNVTVFHWLYVKHTFRRLGIGGDMLRMVKRLSNHDETLPVVGTHHTSTLWDVLSAKWNMIYNPYLMGADSLDDQTEMRQVC